MKGKIRHEYTHGKKFWFTGQVSEKLHDRLTKMSDMSNRTKASLLLELIESGIDALEEKIKKEMEDG
jgi:predicted DNA-binding protein